MATLLNAVTEDTTGSGAAMTGPCTVWVSGSAGGGTVEIQAASSDTAGKYVPMGRITQIQHPRPINVEAYGSYYVRAVLRGSTSPSLTVETTQ